MDRGVLIFSASRHSDSTVLTFSDFSSPSITNWTLSRLSDLLRRNTANPLSPPLTAIRVSKDCMFSLTESLSAQNECPVSACDSVKCQDLARSSRTIDLDATVSGKLHMNVPCSSVAQGSFAGRSTGKVYLSPGSIQDSGLQFIRNIQFIDQGYILSSERFGRGANKNEWYSITLLPSTPDEPVASLQTA